MSLSYKQKSVCQSFVSKEVERKLVKVVEMEYFCKIKRLYMKFPIGIQDFKTLRNDGFVYVDKTGLLRVLSTYLVLTEKQQSEGRADCIIETKKGIYIFEFKLDGTADDALRQIEDKGYARPYYSDQRPVRKIGVNFSSQSGTIDDWKEA